MWRGFWRSSRGTISMHYIRSVCNLDGPGWVHFAQVRVGVSPPRATRRRGPSDFGDWAPGRAE